MVSRGLLNRSLPSHVQTFLPALGPGDAIPVVSDLARARGGRAWLGSCSFLSSHSSSARPGTRQVLSQCLWRCAGFAQVKATPPLADFILDQPSVREDA